MKAIVRFQVCYGRNREIQTPFQVSDLKSGMLHARFTICGLETQVDSHHFNSKFLFVMF